MAPTALVTHEANADVSIAANVNVAADPSSGHGQSGAVPPAVAGAVVSKTLSSRLSKDGTLIEYPSISDVNPFHC